MGDTRFLFEDILENKLTVSPVDKEAVSKVQKEWDKVAKPINSFGSLKSR